MSNVVSLHAFSSNKPLQTIEESANTEYDPLSHRDPRIKQWEDIYQPAKPGSEDWQSTASDSSDRTDEPRDSPRTEARLRSGRVPPRTSSNRHPVFLDSDGSDHTSAQRSSPRESGTFSIEGSSTEATSAIQQPLKDAHPDNEEQSITPLDEFDLAAPVKDGNYLHSLETLSDFLFASEHLRKIFADPSSLLDFTSFVSACRPKSIPMLMYYLDATEAVKAVNYAITIAQSLEPIPGHDFTSDIVKTTMNSELEDKAEKAFKVIVQDDLPAFVTQLYVQTVKSSMMRRITGPSAQPMRDAPDGMLEVFCLTDPSRPDNPIVFASKAFHQMTQYSMGYVIGRNCRFLQGPKTDKSSVERIRQALQEGRDHCDLLLNYRRDGSPFMNLLMLAHLRDMNGNVRYILGAQIDVSNLVPDSTDLDDAASQKNPQLGFVGAAASFENVSRKDEPQDASGMRDGQDRKSIQKWRARTLQEQAADDDRSIDNEFRRPRTLLRDVSCDSLFDSAPEGWVNSKLSGFYQNYLLVRPYPSLRVLFASPSLRVPGILQSPIMDKIGGSPQVRDELTQALAQGRSVTAKVRWIMKPGDRDHNRWIAFTPLVGSHNQIGVWIAILVDDEMENGNRPRQAPPVKFRAAPVNRVAPPKKSALPAPAQPSIVPNKDRDPDVFWEKAAVVLDKPLPSPKELPGQSTTPPASIDPSINALVPEIDETYETLEQRLRKKRDRDAARLLAGGVPIKPTYKSLSPYAFMNNDGT